MRGPAGRSDLRRSGGCSLVLLTLWATVGASACQKWVTVTESPLGSAAVRDEEAVLVVLRSGPRIEMSQPIRFEGDSLSGISRWAPPTERTGPARRIAVPLADVSELRVRRSDEFHTGFVVAGAVVVALFGFFYWAAASSDT